MCSRTHANARLAPVTKGLPSSGPAQDSDTAGGSPGRGPAEESDTAGGPASRSAAGDPAVDAWRGLLVAHSRLVPAVEGDLRAAGQVPLSWYDVLLELNAAPDRRLRMSELGQRTVLSRTRVSRVVDELAVGLVRQAFGQPGGRSSFAVLTPEGQDAL